MEFGLFFFAAESAGEPDCYSLLRDAVRCVDGRLRFISVPERHYHHFGGLYPVPALALAALSSITTKIELRFGSLIAPLHEPLEMAECYAMLDRLSGGRIGIAFGSGWHRRDFLLRPDRYERRREILFEHVTAFQALVAGGGAASPGLCEPVSVHPAVLRRAPRIWITASASIGTFREAGRRGLNVLSHLEISGYSDLAEKIAAYRAARLDAGHDPRAGVVTLMLHTFVHDLEREVQRAVGGLKAYLEAALDLEAASVRLTGRMSGGRPADARDLRAGSPRQEVIDLAVERYLSGASLIGSREQCAAVVAEAAACGVDEIACLIDYLPDRALVLSGLSGLLALAEEHSSERRTRERQKLIAELVGVEGA